MRVKPSWLIIAAATVALEVNSKPINRAEQEKLEFSPKNAGLYHTEAFNALGKIYKNKLPEDEIDIILDVSNIMSTFCPEGDFTCHPHRVTLETFNTLRNGPLNIDYPKEFDPYLKQTIKKTFSTVNKLNELNVDEIVEKLMSIQDDLDELKVDKKNQAYHTLALASVSVAIESTKLWHAAFNDPEHDFNTMVEIGKRRRLQLYIPLPQIDMTKVINADIYGSVAGGLLELQANSTLFFLPFEFIIKALLRSISFSSYAIFDFTNITSAPWYPSP